MSEEVIEIVFTALGVLFVFPRIPQLVRIYKRKSSLDISIAYWNLLNILTLPWLWYFWHKNSMSAFISNLLAMILNTAVVLLAYKYRRN